MSLRFSEVNWRKLNSWNSWIRQGNHEYMRDPECSVDSYMAEDVFYFRSISVFSALEVSYDNALYKFTFDIDIDNIYINFLLLL